MKIQKNMILGSIKKENKKLVNKIKEKENIKKKIITYKKNPQTINYKLSFWLWKIDEKINFFKFSPQPKKMNFIIYFFTKHQTI